MFKKIINTIRSYLFFNFGIGKPPEPDIKDIIKGHRLYLWPKDVWLKREDNNEE